MTRQALLTECVPCTSCHYHHGKGAIFTVTTRAPLPAIPTGTVVKIACSLLKEDLRGIVVRTNSAENKLYCLTFDPCPTCLVQQAVELTVTAQNEFIGHKALQAVHKKVLFLIKEPLVPAVRELAAHIESRGNQVKIAPLTHQAIDNWADVLFLAAPENEIRTIIAALPRSFHGQICYWAM